MLYICENIACIFELRFGPIVASWQDRRPLGYASSLSSHFRDPTGSLIKFPFSLASPFIPALTEGSAAITVRLHAQRTN